MRVSTIRLASVLATSILLLVVIGVFGVRQYQEYLSPGSRYQRTNFYSDLKQALADQIRPGMSRAEVAEIIGPGVLKPIEFVDRYVQLQMEGKWPAGYAQPGDRVVEYRSDAQVIHGLEFRNDRLVNFDPAHYASSNDAALAMSAR